MHSYGIWTRYFWKRAAENAISAGGTYALSVVSLWQLDAINAPTYRSGVVFGCIAVASILKDIVTSLKTRTSDPSIVLDHALKNGGLDIPDSDESVQFTDTDMTDQGQTKRLDEGYKEGS